MVITDRPTGPEGAAGQASRPSVLAAVGWWALTVVALVVLDDLTFGPVFWLISLVGSPLAGFCVAILVYFPTQVLLVRAGTSLHPPRPAAFLLRRLDLTRRSDEVARRERRLWERITGAATALIMSLLVGGVLPPLVLRRREWSVEHIRRLSYATALVYALEFALIHGFVPGSLAGR